LKIRVSVVQIRLRAPLFPKKNNLLGLIMLCLAAFALDWRASPFGCGQSMQHELRHAVRNYSDDEEHIEAMMPAAAVAILQATGTPPSERALHGARQGGPGLRDRWEGVVPDAAG
jgi:hypothetical protein